MLWGYTDQHCICMSVHYMAVVCWLDGHGTDHMHACLYHTHTHTHTQHTIIIIIVTLIMIINFVCQK